MLDISFPRREDSLDVEVSASGYTKEMQADDELLHPVGPDDIETEEGSEFLLYDEEVSEKAKVDGSENQSERNSVDESVDCCGRLSGDLKQIKEDDVSEETANAHSFDMIEFSRALEEMKGQAVENNSVTHFSGEKHSTENDTRQDGKRGQGGSPTGSEEDEDERPHLTVLSSLNKEFRSFRYRFLWIDFFTLIWRPVLSLILVTVFFQITWQLYSELAFMCKMKADNPFVKIPISLHNRPHARQHIDSILSSLYKLITFK